MIKVALPWTSWECTRNSKDIDAELFVKLNMMTKYIRALYLYYNWSIPISIELEHYGAVKLSWEESRCTSCLKWCWKIKCHILIDCHLYKDINNSFYHSFISPMMSFICLKNDEAKICLMQSKPICVRLVARIWDSEEKHCVFVCLTVIIVLVSTNLLIMGLLCTYMQY